ncbi:MAG: TGS domain-containing protein [Phycisphaerae bacterium]|nr:TGS domain-containing protein [Phycisphaerae bacterium]
MPANLTPEYEKADRRFREAGDDTEKLDALREMLRAIPKHKGTDHMQADIKRRISQMRKAVAKKGPSKGFDQFHVPKSGAGQIALVGPPNTGKSHLVATTTNAPVKVAEYPYSTALPAPGMWTYEDVQIQLVDTPPITPEHVMPGLMGTINFADVIAVVIDISSDPPEQIDIAFSVLSDRGLELSPLPCNRLDPENHHRRSALLIANKVDLVSAGDVDALRELYTGGIELFPVSAESGEGLDALGRRLWELLAVIRVYTKQPGKPVDKDRPYTLATGSTINDLAAEIHRDLPEKIKFARIWGEGRFDGQRAHRSEILHDKDIVEIHQ